MKKLLIILVLTSFSCDDDDGKKYTSAAGNYTYTFPASSYQATIKLDFTLLSNDNGGYIVSSSSATINKVTYTGDAQIIDPDGDWSKVNGILFTGQAASPGKYTIDLEELTFPSDFTKINATGTFWKVDGIGEYAYANQAIKRAN
jgi:hypothetical protein